ncbi:hypothetical protein E2C01_017874 [Portunus trituberculatus]|uniref:Uncharacterized protein n=1 Tax=Portunus trituberculatus TaxID=210409 RepID=A0A5B7DT34_PORTR|nr:hypothetical protein [Portunus trituberculatus]
MTWHAHLKGLSLGQGKDLQKRGSSSSPPGQAGSPLHKSIKSRHNVLVWQRAILSRGQGSEFRLGLLELLESFPQHHLKAGWPLLTRDSAAQPSSLPSFPEVIL